MVYAFLLGREPLLSLAELGSRFPDAHFSQVHPQIVTADVPKISAEHFAKLGGTIKVGLLRHTCPVESFVADPIAELTSSPMEKAIEGKSSLAIALSFFGTKPAALPSAKQIGISWKKKVRISRSHVRFVEARTEKITSSVTVTRNKLLEGFDCWCVFHNNDVLFIQTIAVQDYQSFAKRDYGRPAINPVSGMLPPKLARMLIALSGADAHATLYDPFVGSGTVLLEAAALGIHKLIGSDSSELQVEATEKNLQWLSEHIEQDSTAKLFTSDIAHVHIDHVSDTTHIVTEIDLGPPLRSHAPIEVAEQHANAAGKLANALVDLCVRMPALSRCVIALPAWRVGGDEHIVSTPLHGSKKLRIVPANPEWKRWYPEEFSSRNGYVYARPDQHVMREILVLEKSE